MYSRSFGRKGFTLIELLVVIAIIAILAVVVILTLNPAELLRQARDSNRVSDMATLTSALGVYVEDQGSGSNFSLGSSNVVYISIPDPSATSTLGTNCASLGLPTLPASYTYHCVSISNSKNIDGTGWIPLNFKTISSNSPIGNLPVDPANNSSSRLYYTYTTSGANYEVTCVMESQKYGVLGTQDQISGDGGALASVYEKGTKFGLEPLDYGDTGLADLWTFEEGNGTVNYDYSGNNDTSNASGTPLYVPGKIGSYAASFNGLGTYTEAPIGNYFGQNNPWSVAAWTYINASSSGPIFGVTSANPPTAWNMPFLSENGAMVYGWVYNNAIISSTVASNSWHHLVLTYAPSGGGLGTLYIDGQAVGTSTGAYSGSGAFDYFANYMPGVKPVGVQSYFTGNIDDVRAYTRTLSAAQVAALYNGGK
jgi:prepilin-type N-terminal cleavage/methylation domain-containing protein